MRDATEMGCLGIHKVLDLMDSCLSSPRTDKSDCLPATDTIRLPAPYLRSRLVGPGGLHLRRIEAETGARLTASDDGVTFSVFAPNPTALEEAKRMAEEAMAEETSALPREGAIITVKVVEVREKGARVKMPDWAEPVLIPLSQLSARKASAKTTSIYESHFKFNLSGCEHRGTGLGCGH